MTTFNTLQDARTASIAVRAIVHHVMHSGSAFASNADGDHIFIPASLTKRFKVRENDLIAARVVPNDHPAAPDGVPYRAIHVVRVGPLVETVEATQMPAQEAVEAAEPEIVEQSLEQRREMVLDYMRASDLPFFTTAEIAEHFGWSAVKDHWVMGSLHADGRLAKAYVYAKAGQKRASVTIWALSVTDLIGHDAKEQGNAY